MILLAMLVLAASAVDSYRQANELFIQKRFNEAAVAIDSALREDPAMVPALTLKAKLAMAANRNDIAEVCLKQAVHLNAEAAYPQFLFGFFYYLQNDFKKALPPLQIAHRLEPSDSRAVFYLALSYEGLAETEEACAMYRLDEEIEAKAGRQSAETEVAFGRLLFSLGRFQECRERVEKALELDPASRDAHYELGRLDLRDGNARAAAAEGERALGLAAIGTTDRQIHYLVGRAYLELGENRKAASHLSQFEASAPTLRR